MFNVCSYEVLLVVLTNLLIGIKGIIDTLSTNLSEVHGLRTKTCDNGGNKCVMRFISIGKPLKCSIQFDDIVLRTVKQRLIEVKLKRSAM